MNPSTCFSVSLICAAATCAGEAVGKPTKTTAIDATKIRYMAMWRMAEPPGTYGKIELEPISKSFEEDDEAGKLDKAEEIVGVVLPGMRIHKELRLPNFKRGANEPLLAWPARIREAKGRRR